MEITLTAAELHVLSIAVEKLIEVDESDGGTLAHREALAVKLNQLDMWLMDHEGQQVVLRSADGWIDIS